MEQIIPFHHMDLNQLLTVDHFLNQLQYEFPHRRIVHYLTLPVCSKSTHTTCIHCGSYTLHVLCVPTETDCLEYFACMCRDTKTSFNPRPTFMYPGFKSIDLNTIDDKIKELLKQYINAEKEESDHHL